MRKQKKGLALFHVTAIMTIALTGCTSSGTDQKVAKDERIKSSKKDSAQAVGIKDLEPETLKIYLFGSEGAHYRNIEEVIEEIENRTRDTLNVTLDITWTLPEEYKKNLPMWIAAGEEMDLVFDAPSCNLIKLASDGAYQDVSSYFNNPEYPGLMRAFSKQYMENNQYLGKTYAIPITNTFMDMEGLWYRKDLLEKYGLGPIETYGDLYNFLTVIAENEKDYVPHGNYGPRGFFKQFGDFNKKQLEGRVYPFLEYIDVVISSDGKSVAGVANWGDEDEAYSQFPAKYGKEFWVNLFHTTKEWNQFMPKDILAAGGTDIGKSAAVGYITISNFTNVIAVEKQKHPEAELAFWPMYENARNLTPGGQPTDYRAWNYVCVPTSSQKVDRTMKFIDWVYANQENNDLISYGIKGKNWEDVEGTKWKVPEGMKPTTNYAWPGYELGWNPNYIRIPVALPEDAIKYMEYQYKEDTFTLTDIAGFTFDQEPVKIEVAKCAPIADKYITVLWAGLAEDPEEYLKKFNDELGAAGVDKIKNELKKQLNEFLAQKHEIKATR